MAYTTDTTLPHHRLDAYRVALDLVAAADPVAAAIPRGRRELADQLKRLDLDGAAYRRGRQSPHRW